MRNMICVCLLSFFAIVASAESPYLVSPDGTYLGNLSGNKYAPNSVSNPYGQYGSKYSPKSMNVASIWFSLMQ